MAYSVAHLYRTTIDPIVHTTPITDKINYLPSLASPNCSPITIMETVFAVVVNGYHKFIKLFYDVCYTLFSLRRDESCEPLQLEREVRRVSTTVKRLLSYQIDGARCYRV
jgi:hypothetical protein